MSRRRLLSAVPALWRAGCRARIAAGSSRARACADRAGSGTRARATLAEPARDRHREALFLAADDALGQPAQRGALEQVFSDLAVEPQVVGQRHAEFEQLVIEERHAQLHRRAHRHLVGLDEQVVRQPRLQVHVRHALERAGVFEVGEEPAEMIRDGLADARAEFGREQALERMPRRHVVGNAPVTALERRARPVEVLGELLARRRGARRARARPRPGRARQGRTRPIGVMMRYSG